MSVDACAEIVRRGDPDRFLAAMASPPAARAVLFPLYAFNVEVARAPWVSQEPMICEIRLQWWADALGEVDAGEPPRAHEVVAPLAEMIRVRGLPVAPLLALIEARRWDIYRDPFADTGQFERYLDATAAGLMWVAARALGTPPEAETAVRGVGWASGLAAYLRAVPDLAARGRQPLSDDSAAALTTLAGNGLKRLAASRAGDVPRAAQPALLAGWRAGSTLKRAVADPAGVAAGRLVESEFARRSTLLLRSLTGRW